MKTWLQAGLCALAAMLSLAAELRGVTEHHEFTGVSATNQHVVVGDVSVTVIFSDASELLGAVRYGDAA
jgi:hypothetical protein